MFVSDCVCSAIYDWWTCMEENTGLFKIPVIGNILNGVLSFVWGLFGCDSW